MIRLCINNGSGLVSWWCNLAEFSVLQMEDDISIATATELARFGGRLELNDINELCAVFANEHDATLFLLRWA